MQGGLHGDEIAIRAEAGDHGLDGGRQLRMTVKLVARMDVRDVHFEGRPVEDLDRIEHCRSSARAAPSQPDTSRRTRTTTERTIRRRLPAERIQTRRLGVRSASPRWIHREIR